MKRISLVTVATLIALTGCSSEPPPISEKVQKYYDENVANAKAALPSTTATPLTVTPLDAIRARVADDKPLTVSVLGDSTGNDAGEWVDLWARHLAANATVTLHTWKEGAATWPTVTYGSSERKVTIWNGSQPGSSGDYARTRLLLMQPEKPGLVIYNYGHNVSPNGTANDEESLQRSANTQWGAQIPFVVTLQNAARGKYAAGSDKSVADLKAWGEPKKVPLIDIRSEITAQDLEALLLDEVHPNKQGSQIWADKVIETLG